MSAGGSEVVPDEALEPHLAFRDLLGPLGASADAVPYSNEYAALQTYVARLACNDGLLAYRRWPVGPGTRKWFSAFDLGVIQTHRLVKEAVKSLAGMERAGPGWSLVTALCDAWTPVYDQFAPWPEVVVIGAGSSVVLDGESVSAWGLTVRVPRLDPALFYRYAATRRAAAPPSVRSETNEPEEP